MGPAMGFAIIVGSIAAIFGINRFFHWRDKQKVLGSN
jgi:hypothetical protein